MKTVAEIDLEVRRRQLWVYAVASACVMIGWQIYFGIMNRYLGRQFPLLIPRVIHASILVGVVLWLFRARQTVTLRQLHLAGLFVLLPLPFVLWVTQEINLARGWPEPFSGNRIAVVMVAILLPAGPRTVLLAASGLALVSFLHFELRLPRATELGSPLEPWLLLFHWFIACTVLLLRVLVERLQRQYQRTRAALVALLEMAKATRALRDGAYSPLQTIDTIAYLTRTFDPRMAEAADRLTRSSSRLRAVIEAMNYDEFVDWDVEDLRFRAEQRLTMLRAKLVRDAGGGQPFGRDPTPPE